MKRKLGVGLLETSGASMVLAYGKTSVKNGSPSLKMLFPPLEMVEDWVFGRILGTMRPC